MKSFLEHTVLITQSLCYLTTIGVLILLANMFWQNIQSQNAAHQRADAHLQQSLQRSDQLLYESRQSLADHQQQMQRFAR